MNGFLMISVRWCRTTMAGMFQEGGNYSSGGKSKGSTAWNVHVWMVIAGRMTAVCCVTWTPAVRPSCKHWYFSLRNAWGAVREMSISTPVWTATSVTTVPVWLRQRRASKYHLFTFPASTSVNDVCDSWLAMLQARFLDLASPARVYISVTVLSFLAMGKGKTGCEQAGHRGLWIVPCVPSPFLSGTP